MANEPQERRSNPGMGWPIAIFIGTAMLAGGFAGYNKAAAETGDATLAPWVGPLVAIILGGGAIALYVRRHADMFRRWSPRKRLYWASILISGALGMVIAITMSAGQANAGANLFSDSVLTAPMAIGLALLWVVGLGVAMAFYHRSVDDHERHAYYLGCVAGFYAFIVACPIWWVLARADLVRPVEAMPIFLLSMIVNALVYCWYKFR